MLAQTAQILKKYLKIANRLGYYLKICLMLYGTILHWVKFKFKGHGRGKVGIRIMSFKTKTKCCARST